MPTITSVVKKTTVTGRIVIPPYAAHNNLAQSTTLVYIRPTLDDGSLDYLFTKHPAGSGPRFFQISAVQFTYGTASASGSQPNRASLNAPQPGLNNWHNIAATDAGGAAASTIKIYMGLSGSPIAEVSAYGTANDGSGSRTSDASNSIYLFDRDDQARGWQGSCAYIARWNRVLSLAELQTAQNDGPLSVPNGLIFCWANNQDYSGLSAAPTINTAATSSVAGDLPPNLNLGTQAVSIEPDNIEHTSQTGTSSLGSEYQLDPDGVEHSHSIAASTITDVSPATVFDGDYAGANINLVASSITNATSNNPSLNVTIRGPDDGLWQVFGYSAENVAGKSLLNVINLTGKEDTTALQAGYDGPWWTDNINDCDSWQKVESYVANGSTMTFTINPGAANKIWVANVPPGTEQQVLDWINKLSAAYPGLVHDDLYARQRYGDGPYIVGYTDPATDENGRSIPGRPQRAFRMGRDNLGAQAPFAKRTIIVSAQIHSGEWLAFQQLRGFCDELAGGIHSNEIFSGCNVYVIPIMANNSSYLGYRRNEIVGTTHLDINREFGVQDYSSSTVAKWHQILYADHGYHFDHVVLYIDFHDAKATSDRAFFYMRSTAANRFAIASIINAENAELDMVESSLAGTTTDFFYGDKGVPVVINPEVADEKATIAEYRAFGAAYARAIKGMLDAGHLPLRQTYRFAEPVALDFEADFDGSIDGGGQRQWTRQSGPTPTAGVGPDYAAHGSFYIYTESTGAAVNDEFLRDFPANFAALREIQFRYNRRGNTGSTLSVEVWNGSAWQERFSTNVNQTSSFWRTAAIDVSDLSNVDGMYRFKQRITASPAGNNDTGIDDIRLYSYNIAAVLIEPDSIEHGHYSAAPLVTDGYAVAPSAIEHLQYTSESLIEIGVAITPNTLESAQEMTVPAVTDAYSLAPNSMTHGSESTAPLVGVGLQLEPVDITHDHVMISAVLGVSFSLSPAAMEHSQQIAAVDVLAGIGIEPASLQHSHEMLTPTLSLAISINPFSMTHNHAIAITVLTGTGEGSPVGEVFFALPAERRAITLAR